MPSRQNSDNQHLQLSLSDLISQLQKWDDNQVFKIMDTDTEVQRFVMIKVTQLKEHEQNSFMIQISDVSTNILLNKQKSQNELLSLINATVSHEMRNPLNSICA
jgi:signal transduction histidine kinase